MLLSWSSPWGRPSWLQPHAVTSDQYLGRHTSTALTCREYTPLGKFRLSLKASARYQLSSRALKIRGCECASTISSFCYFFLKKWSISLLTPWYLPRVHQRQRQEADCWGWLRCRCCWLQGLNCDDEKKTKKSLSLKTLLEGGHYFCGGLVPGPAALPPWWILHKHWDVLGWRLAHKDTLCQGVISVKEMEVGFS